MTLRAVGRLLFCLAGALGVVAPAMAQDAYVDTPFGKVPKECYWQHPSGTTLSRIANGVRARHADGTTRDYVSSERCLAFGRSFKPRQPDTAVPAAYPNNHWFNFAAWLSPQNVGRFTATYSLPGFPASPGPQILFYFIGLEDIDSVPVAILQPVLRYADGAYSLSSWNCCPSGQSHQGNIVTGMKPGDMISTSITRISQSPSIYSINGVWAGKTADLTVQVDDSEAFIWPNVTLEIFHMTTCSQFPTGPFVFGQLYLADVNDQPLTPTWRLEPSGGTTPCGRLGVNGPTITIEQNPPPGQRR
jgi:hypothetical protein